MDSIGDVAPRAKIEKNVIKVLPFMNYSQIKIANESAARANSNSLARPVLPSVLEAWNRKSKGEEKTLPKRGSNPQLLA